MVFSSFTFLLYFLPVFLAVYYLVPAGLKNPVLFGGSLIFYFYGVKEHPYYLLLMVFTLCVNYVLALQMKGKTGKKNRTLCLFPGLIWNFGCLLAFKLLYQQLVLPVGISFYTFQISAYLIDVYRRKVPAERSFVNLGTYLCMFPQLIAGPIVTYQTVQEQLVSRKQSYENFEEGFREFTIGLALKVLVANQLGGLWAKTGVIGYESISTPMAWLGIIAYSFQLYFDFYGYSLMAKGLGRMLGFYLPDNFDNPYLSHSMTEFWRRWHMTLGSWFREYVYIPLGGNRSNMMRNLFLVWMFTGLWHGASWNFLLWGFSLFLLVSVEKAGFGNLIKKIPWIGRLYMCLAIPVTWLMFAVTDPVQMKIYFSRLFPILDRTGLLISVRDFLKYGKMYLVSLLAAFILCSGLPRKVYEKTKYSLVTTLILVFLFWSCIYCMYMGLDDPFLYYQF